MPAPDVVRAALAELGVCTPLHIQQLVDQVIDEFAPTGREDLVLRFAVPVPVLAMPGFCGMDESYAAGAGRALPALLGESVDPARAASNLRTLLARLVAEMAADPGPDLVSWTVNHHAGGPEADVVDRLYSLVLEVAELAAGRISSTLADCLPGPGRTPGDSPTDLMAFSGPPRTAAALADLIGDTAVARLLERLPRLWLRVPRAELALDPSGLPTELPVQFPPVRIEYTGEIVDRLPAPVFTIAPPVAA
ncbi:hypothetical protein [Streptomyces sp. t39]|uniref:hypothetical protein n=1 Tax=Streptomyces sp. t39 TaxID=1828156 RepID=UPI0011CE3ACF|nr:hypothetical protein [Streptomyces sp. t39]TXS52262.1 hypothetical protein EAO77_20900 [Streptomyces sp. t39]